MSTRRHAHEHDRSSGTGVIVVLAIFVWAGVMTWFYIESVVKPHKTDDVAPTTVQVLRAVQPPPDPEPRFIAQAELQAAPEPVEGSGADEADEAAKIQAQQSEIAVLQAEIAPPPAETPSTETNPAETPSTASHAEWDIFNDLNSQKE